MLSGSCGNTGAVPEPYHGKMRHCCSLILAVQALAFQIPGPHSGPHAGPHAGPTSGVIEGSVIDSVSGEPIRQAAVTLVPIPIVMGIRPTGLPTGLPT